MTRWCHGKTKKFHPASKEKGLQNQIAGFLMVFLLFDLKGTLREAWPVHKAPFMFWGDIICPPKEISENKIFRIVVSFSYQLVNN